MSNYQTRDKIGKIGESVMWLGVVEVGLFPNHQNVGYVMGIVGGLTYIGCNTPEIVDGVKNFFNRNSEVQTPSELEVRMEE